MALLLPLLLPRIALILVALVTMAVISYLAGYGWCARAPPMTPGASVNPCAACAGCKP